MDFSNSIPLKTNQQFIPRPASSGGFSMHMQGIGTQLGNNGIYAKPRTPTTPAFIPGSNGHIDM